MVTDTRPGPGALADPPREAAPPQSGILARLAELPSDALVDAKTLASALGMSSRTAQRLVCQGQLPPGFILGGKRVWFAGRVLAWLARRAEAAEKEAARFPRNAS